MWSTTSEILYTSEGIVFECPEDPARLVGMPLGMYHCPPCGCMVIAGLDHGPHDLFCWLGLWPA